MTLTSRKTQQEVRLRLDRLDYELLKREIRDAVREELEAHERLDGWKPIEGAPKDGRIIWAGSKHALCVSYWAGEDEKCWRNWYKGCRYQNHHLGTDAYLPEPIWFTPTHWKPLPLPPEADHP